MDTLTVLHTFEFFYFFWADLQSVISASLKFVTKHLQKPKLWLSLHPANEGEKEGFGSGKQAKNKKNKVCKIKKGSYLCT
ncbi:MAG TPA: hypothetical protein DCO83_17840, partial [Mucilaginibacter sp.]|nr:hypothetical protein [Mucilaginibacter sp.]